MVSQDLALIDLAIVTTHTLFVNESHGPKYRLMELIVILLHWPLRIEGRINVSQGFKTVGKSSLILALIQLTLNPRRSQLFTKAADHPQACVLF